MRERLIELILNAPKTDVVYGNIKLDKPIQTAKTIADYLLASGVIVPPCKVGDTVYITFADVRIIEQKVARIAIEPIEKIGFSVYCYGGFNFDNRHFGKTVFLTKEEAEKALERSSNEKI